MVKNTKGFTLAECLLVMITGGIVLLAIMEGYTLITGYVSGRTEEMDRRQRTYHDLNLLSETLSVCDSITVEDDKVSVYFRGRKTLLSFYDNMLILQRDRLTDTLLTDYGVQLEVVGFMENRPTMPQIKLTISSGGNLAAEHVFSPGLSGPAGIKINMEKAEEPYLYDR
ncbi:MAG: hypothetical protein LIO77_07865 [Rikenellaceae bacterium]|nr:hypothetical protein [Rikenellaceae bacterium]